MISPMFLRSLEDVSTILHPGRIPSISILMRSMVALSTRSVLVRMMISASRIWCAGMRSTVSTVRSLSFARMSSALTQSTTTQNGATLNSSGYMVLIGDTTLLMRFVEEPIGSAMIMSGLPVVTKVLALDTNSSKFLQKHPPMISLVSIPASLE